MHTWAFFDTATLQKEAKEVRKDVEEMISGANVRSSHLASGGVTDIKGDLVRVLPILTRSESAFLSSAFNRLTCMKSKSKCPRRHLSGEA
jgi:hypothetical protein